MKANSNLAVLNILARLGCGFDIVSGGELARVRRRRRRSRRRSSSPASARRRPRWRPRSRRASAASTSNPPRSSTRWTRSPAAPAGARRCRSASTRTSIPKTHPVHRDRPQGEQVRRRLRRRAGALPARGGPAARRGARHRLPHRLADHRPRGVRRGGREDVRPRRPDRGATASPSTTSTWAAGSASATATSTTIDPQAYARAVRAGAGHAPARAAVRAGPLPRRRRRRAADARHLPQARREPRLRDRRRRDERPDPPGALRRLARGRRRCARATAPRAAGRSSDRSARAAISSRTTASSPSPPATFSPSRAAGAYGFVMSSNYNSRPRACEVIVDGDRVHLARPRETRRRSLRARIACCRDARAQRARAASAAFSCVRIRNTRARNARNRRGNLAIQKNVARIQAAGSNGFVKRLQFSIDDDPGAACDEAEAP